MSERRRRKQAVDKPWMHKTEQASPGSSSDSQTCTSKARLEVARGGKYLILVYVVVNIRQLVVHCATFSQSVWQYSFAAQHCGR
jgi:hypothetical protein